MGYQHVWKHPYIHGNMITIFHLWAWLPGPKRKRESIPAIHFQVAFAVSFREGTPLNMEIPPTWKWRCISYWKWMNMGIFQPVMSVFRRFSSSTVRKSACHESDFVVVTLGPSRGSGTGRFEGTLQRECSIPSSLWDLNGPCVYIYTYIYINLNIYLNKPNLSIVVPKKCDSSPIWACLGLRNANANMLTHMIYIKSMNHGGHFSSSNLRACLTQRYPQSSMSHASNTWRQALWDQITEQLHWMILPITHACKD